MSNPDGSVSQLDLFFNTTHLTREQVKLRMQGNRYQNGKILKFFEDNPEGLFTPFEVQEYGNLDMFPITSIRRGINTLTDAGLLIKTDKMKPGKYGAVNHTWKLNNEHR